MPQAPLDGFYLMLQHVYACPANARSVHAQSDISSLPKGPDRLEGSQTLHHPTGLILLPQSPNILRHQLERRED